MKIMFFDEFVRRELYTIYDRYLEIFSMHFFT